MSYTRPVLASGAAILLLALAGTSARAAVLSNPDTQTVSGPGGLALSPDTGHLYVVSNQGNGDVALFTRSSTDGKLTRVNSAVDLASCGSNSIKVPSSVVVTNDGASAYVTARGANGSTGTLTGFSRDAGTGKLTCIQNFSSKSLKGAKGVSVTSDGKTVYIVVSAGKTQGVRAYSRDTGTGLLTFLNAYLDGRNGANFLSGASDTAVAGDEKKVYVTAAGDNALTTFDRAVLGTVGSLTFSANLRDGVGGADALAGAASLVISADGRTVYTAAPSDNAVGVFARDTTSGALSYSSKAQNGTGNIAGLGGVTGVAVSPDNAYVFAAAPGGGALSLFGRDGRTGAIGFIEAATLAGARNVVAAGIANGGTCAYVTTSGNVAVYCLGGSYGAFDFGDAPDSYGTTIASTGARHIVGSAKLGSAIDSEPDGIPGVSATGDDLANLDDEDGADFGVTQIQAGQAHDVTVTGTAGAKFDAWIDYNQDGDFNDPGEQIAAGLTLPLALNTLTFTPPASGTANGDTYARFRVRTSGSDGINPSGGAGEGEVEDYKINVFSNTDNVTVTKSGSGSGTVIGSVDTIDQGINCGTTCTAPYGTGSNVSLRAQPATGSTFTQWSGGNPACSGNGTCDFNSISQSQIVDAEFTLIPYTLQVQTDLGGSVASTPGGIACPGDCSEVYDFGTQVQLDATPDTGNGYVFTGWEGGGCSGIGSCVVTISGDTTVMAHFEKDVYHLHIDATALGAADGTGTITVTDGLTNPSCASVCDYFYDINANVGITLSAIADPDSAFEGWNDNGCTGQGACAFTMDADRTVVTGFDFSMIQVTVVDDSPAVNGGNLPTDGNPVRVKITVTNTSSTDTPTANVTLTSVFPTSNGTLSSWTCAATNTTCQHANGTANLNESLNMAADSQVVFTVVGTAANPAFGGFLTSATANDPDLGGRHSANNSSTGMTKYLKIFSDGEDTGVNAGTLNAWSGHT